MAVSKIAQHHHCRQCGKAFAGEDKYCSEACESLNVGTIQKKKKQLLFLYVISFIVLIVAVVFLA
jgi:predicted nucleic acid-binding Zn ribbon protein